MNDWEMQSLLEGCLKYMRESKLPTPLPNNPLEYADWQERVLAKPEMDEDAEEAWHELDRLIVTEPLIGWKILTELASRCEDEDECDQIAAGPLRTFLRAHREAFSAQIEEELMANTGFRHADNWLRV